MRRGASCMVLCIPQVWRARLSRAQGGRPTDLRAAPLPSGAPCPQGLHGGAATHPPGDAVVKACDGGRRPSGDGPPAWSAGGPAGPPALAIWRAPLADDQGGSGRIRANQGDHPCATRDSVAGPPAAQRVHFFCHFFHRSTLACASASPASAASPFRLWDTAVEHVAEEDDEHPTEKSNRPIGQNEGQYGERCAQDQSDKDDIEEERPDPPSSARRVAMPEHQSCQESEGEHLLRR